MSQRQGGLALGMPPTPRPDWRTRLTPTPDRLEPAVWVERLVILRALSAEPASLIRDIHLRRGLNIIWAPGSLDEHPGQELASLAGHTAGKTMLCRMLRHALGEPHFADQATTEAVRLSFPQGWIVAEVWVAGARWVVGRPLGLGRHPFCVEGGTIEAACAGEQGEPYSAFLDAVEAATTAQLPVGSYPTRQGAVVDWLHLLPWLSRDQECQLGGVHEWRSTRSQSVSPHLNSDERGFVVRAVVNAVDELARMAEANSRRLQSERQEQQSRAQRLQAIADADRERLRALLGAPADALEGLPLEVAVGPELRDRQRLVDDERRAWSESDPSVDLTAKLGEARRVQGAKEQRVEVLQEQLRKLGVALEQRSGAPESIFDHMPPPAGYCCVPIDTARAGGCPMAVDAPADLQARRAEAQAEREKAGARAEIGRLELLLAGALGVAEQARSDADAALRALIEARTAHAEAYRPISARDQEVGILRRLACQVDTSVASAHDCQRRVASLTDQLERAREEMQRHQESCAAALQDLDRSFAAVARELLGDDVEASVELSQGRLRPTIRASGERRSAALDAVRVLAFDIAVILESCSGRGWHPRLAIFDGPRAADLDEGIYGRVLAFLAALDASFAGEAAFQVVVTTTTAPPERLQIDPWLRLRLAGMPGSARLFGVDF